MEEPRTAAFRQQLESLYSISIEISRLHEMPKVLDRALSFCLELTLSEFGFIGLLNGNEQMDVAARTVQIALVAQDSKDVEPRLDVDAEGAGAPRASKRASATDSAATSPRRTRMNAAVAARAKRSARSIGAR